jgi:hypothetical protein
VPNEIVIESMIKGLQPGPTTQYFAMKPPQTLEKLLQKMDEYIRADNDFLQRRVEAYRYSEMTRGFGGRLHPRHVRTIHNPNASDDRANNAQSSQHSSKSSGMQQTSYRPPTPRGRGGRSFSEGRYGNQPRKLFCLLCGEDKGHITRTCQVTIQKQKEIVEAEAGPTYCFMLLSVYSGVHRQSTAYGFSCFSKSLSSFLGSVTTTTTTGACPNL